MGAITIRNFDEGLQEKLRTRADAHGISIEDEVHAIVRDALSKDGDPDAVEASPIRREGKWHLKASFEELMKLSVKPDKPFDQKAISDELYAYLEEE